MNILFKNVFSDSKVFDEAASFWENLIIKYAFEALEGQLFVSSIFCWHPTTKDDGNPIFQCVIKKLKIGIRIIHEEDIKPGEYDLDCWLDDISWCSGFEGDKELVICCCPTEENRDKVETVLKEWILNKRFVKG